MTRPARDVLGPLQNLTADLKTNGFAGNSSGLIAEYLDQAIEEIVRLRAAIAAEREACAALCRIENSTW